MELVLIAFVGTLALIAGELRDLVRHLHIASRATPRRRAASAQSGRSIVQASALTPSENVYDAAA